MCALPRGGELQRVIDGRVAVEVGHRALRLEELRVMHQQVNPAAHLGDAREGVELGVVIGDVRDRRLTVVDAEAEGAPALVRNVERRDLEALDLVRAGQQRVEGPVAANPSGPIGKCGGLMACASTSVGLAPSWSGISTRTCESSRSPAAKNGSPCT